jgi:hypothetical protein
VTVNPNAFSNGHECALTSQKEIEILSLKNCVGDFTSSQRLGLVATTPSAVTTFSTVSRAIGMCACHLVHVARLCGIC